MRKFTEVINMKIKFFKVVLPSFIRFNNNEIIVENFRANAGKTDLIVKGKIINAFNWMFDANESIEINASLQSKLVILDEFE